MSQTQQDEIIGRTIRERNETKAKLGALKSKASDFGTKISDIGRLLLENPARLAFSNVSTDANMRQNVVWMSVAAYPQFQDVVSVCNEIREVEDALHRLNERAKEFGL